MRALKLLKHVIMFVGLGLLVGGINDVLETKAFIGKAESAQGTVIRIEPFKYSSDKVSTTRYRPVIRFSLFTSPDLWFDLEGYVPAGKITVYIKPDDPGTYYMDRSFLSAKKPPPMKDPFPTQTDTDVAGGWNIPLGTAVRSHWPYLLGAPLFGPYWFVLTPVFQLPFGLFPIIFLVSLGLATLPVGKRKAPMSFFALALGLFAAGIALGAALTLFIEIRVR